VALNADRIRVSEPRLDFVINIFWPAVVTSMTDYRSPVYHSA
jgi:hypothetical protein